MVWLKTQMAWAQEILRWTKGAASHYEDKEIIAKKFANRFDINGMIGKNYTVFYVGEDREHRNGIAFIVTH